MGFFLIRWWMYGDKALNEEQMRGDAFAVVWIKFLNLL